ncbi:MAG: HPr family phosphocarrier protein [[Eubacterium] saphenum]|nr:HPr family phosphocarrier protein [[Eubacterium] saphenum]
MTEVKIRLSSVNDVKDFVGAVSFCSCDIDIAADRYIIDAKSIMGIFSLDLSKPLLMKINSTDENEIADVLGKIERFIVRD